ncbi:hypothetical protein [Micromonospora sp. 067-2]|uniref:hypothetical protein n=1 Tax=Micromonospora sp. 067-2 TaxID=2789270 RepID=UPI00397C81D8
MSGATVASATTSGQRPRPAKAAPAVLFQPPDPDLPLPRQPVRPPASASDSAATVQQRPTDRNAAAPVPPDPTGPESATTTATTDTTSTDTTSTAPVATAPTASAAERTASTATPTATPGKRTASPTRRATSARKSAAPKKTVPTPEQEPPAEQAAPEQAAPEQAAPEQAAPEQAAAEQAAAEQALAPADQRTTRDGTDVARASARTPELDLRAVTARLLDHPGFAPELLALAAVRSLGPGAADWAEQLRTRYPDASADGLARLATRRFVRSAGAGGAAAALAGLFAPLAELASVLWTHANLVLHLAAAYGRDPAHPDRAVELLVLSQVHPDAESARAALAAARAADDPVDGSWARAAEAAWRLAAPLTAQAGGWLVLRLASRLLPGAAVLAAALGDGAAADRLAARSVAAYRRTPADPAAG